MERIAIGNSLPYHFYRLVQIFSTTQDMTNTLSTNFKREGVFDDEVTKVKCVMSQINESHTEVQGDDVNTLSFLKVQTLSLMSGIQPQCIR